MTFGNPDSYRDNMTIETMNKTFFTAPRISIVAVIAYHVLLFALIFIRPELDPYWHPISEWAIGRHGWIMVMAFLFSATAYGALFLAVRKEVRGWPGKTGLGILFICFIGTILVGVFVTDPMPAPCSAAQEVTLTTTGTLHLIGGGSALFLLPFAAVLINVSLARRNEAYERWKKRLLITGFIPLAGWIGFMIHLNLYVIPLGDYAYGPAVPLGWPPRLLLLTYACWVISTAWCFMRTNYIST
jgi:hypothetical protein